MAINVRNLEQCVAKNESPVISKAEKVLVVELDAFWEANKAHEAKIEILVDASNVMAAKVDELSIQMRAWQRSRAQDLKNRTVLKKGSRN